MSVVTASRYDDGLGLLHLRNLFFFYLVGQCARASEVLEMSRLFSAIISSMLTKLGFPLLY